MKITKATVGSAPAHEIRIAAEEGNKTAQKEIERRKKNRRGGLRPYWETD